MARNAKKPRGNDTYVRETGQTTLKTANDKVQATPSEFICNYCDRSFSRKYNIVNHIQNYHINKSFFCEICEQKFAGPTGLQQHLIRGHNRQNQPNPQCDICGKTFTRKLNIIPHLATIHSMGVVPSVTCKVCQKKFTTERNLKRHVSKLHSADLENPSCDECNRVFRVKQALVDHIKSVHNVSENNMSSCHLCDQVYCWSRTLKRHLETYHGVKDEFQCGCCDKAYTTKHSLRRHVRTIHGEDLPDEFICEYCSKIFTKKSAVDKHVSRHHGDVPRKSQFSCDCGKGFAEEPSLRQHIKLEHPFNVFYEYCKNYLLQTVRREEMRSRNGFGCEVCFKKFRSLYDLRIHMKSYHDVRLSLSNCYVCFTKFFSAEAMVQHQKICTPPSDVHRCGGCEKLFTSELSLQFHTKVFHPRIEGDGVTGANRAAGHFKCEYCDKEFKSRRNVKKHMECMHLGIHRVKCLECDTFFKEKRNLRKHIRLKHSDCSTFPLCEFCDKRFESAKACKNHLQQAHAYVSDTYPCEICSVSYSCNDSLLLHMKTKHLEEEDAYKCEDCALIVKGCGAFEKHKRACRENVTAGSEQSAPRCVICMRDYSSQKTLKRHIRNFHDGFDADQLAALGSSKRPLSAECESCTKRFLDGDLAEKYLRNKNDAQSIVFKCEVCSAQYSVLEFAVQRHRSAIVGRKRKQPWCDMSDEGGSERSTAPKVVEEIDLDSASDARSDSSSDVEII